jgi:hypothetical protein
MPEEELTARVDRFLRGVLGVPFAPVTGETRLLDFGFPLECLREPVLRLYHMELEPEHAQMPLFELLELLEAARVSAQQRLN